MPKAKVVRPPAKPRCVYSDFTMKFLEVAAVEDRCSTTEAEMINAVAARMSEHDRQFLLEMLSKMK